ncbi:hypothetical protein [Paenibacillus sp. GCM10027626]|uniref:hypothetical protein n=1 Tax=Paenibacillus sp. GCM10027626 TaxID=3273411 RepID=UPI003633503D
MNNKGLKILIGIGLVGAGMWAGTKLPALAEGDNLVPGSIDDPVVTKSYVDQKIAALGSNKGPVNEKPEPPKDNQSTGVEAAGGIEIVSVKAGKTLILKDGAEAIVRVGKAVAYSPDKNGIADVTDGIDIKNGKKVPNDHLIVFPRGGRGLMGDPSQSSNLTVMVRGGYELKATSALAQ